MWIKYWPCNYLEPEFIKEAKHCKAEADLIHEIATKNRNTTGKMSLFSAKKLLYQTEFPSNFDSTKPNICELEDNPLQHQVMLLAEQWP
jgi:hypothetical protein